MLADIISFFDGNCGFRYFRIYRIKDCEKGIMEISKIVIENFKGIEHVELSPVKPINVLIGRNNSGKTSILKCLSFLNEYFNKHSSNPINVPAGYFREGLDKAPELSISISVKQSKEERKEQFIRTKDAWNKNFQPPHITDAAINAQIENDLFSSLTFKFIGLPPKGNFGLVSINTKSNKNKDDATDILIVESENKSPGTQLLGIPLRELLITRQRPEVYPTILDLAKKHSIGNELFIGRGGGNTLTGKPSEFIINVLSPAYEYIVKMFYTAFLVSPYRHANERMSALMCGQLDQNGLNLVNYIHNLNLNNYAIFKDIADFVKRIVPEVGRLHPRFVGKGGAELELAYEWPDGTTVNLANMGGGVEQLIVLGSLLIHQRTACILWEEPESHLHPGAQEVLLDQLERLVGDSKVFLTTHSPVFIRPSSKIAVHIVTNPDGKSARGKTLSEDDLQQAAAVIGARPGHLAQTDIVLYVEGKTGAGVVKEWLKKWPERAKVLRYLQVEVQSLNVDEIANEDELIKALQKINPNLIIFVDRDNDAGKKEPKKSRIILQSKCNTLGIPCIITEKRKIEDYFTREAILEGLPSNLWRNFEKDFDPDKTIGEQLSDGWKAYNYRIAAAMDWEDVQKHKDIIQVFDEIKKYAEELKP